MKSKTLRNVSVVTIVLAVVLAVYAVRLGRQLSQPQELVSEPEAELGRIVVAVGTIEPGREIPAASLRLQESTFEPEGAFHRVEDVAGRTSSVRLVPGEPVLAKHFRGDGAITRRLEEGERAMAVAVDGVIGLGGFIQPGDRVDVLVYVARDQREVEATHAQVLLEDIRVLAYGAKVETDASGEGEPTDARTAVLAVPRDSVSRLMLGASKGRLRLALRSPGENGAGGGEERAVSLEALAGDFARGGRKGAGGGTGPAPPQRLVHRGEPGEITRY